MNIDGNAAADLGFLELIELFLAIRQKSLFNLLGQQSSRRLLDRHARLESYAAGQAIHPESPPNSLYIVASGSVVLHKKGRSIGPDIELTEGKSIELDTLFRADSVWQRDWKAQTACQLMNIHWPAFLNEVRQTQNLEPYLRTITLGPELQRLKNDLRLFGLTFREVAAMIARMVREPAAAAMARPGRILICAARGDLLLKVGDAGAGRITLGLAVGDYTTLTPSMPGLQWDSSEGSEHWVIPFDDLHGLVSTSTAENLVRLTDRIASAQAGFKKDRQPESTPAPFEIVATQEDDGLKVEDFLQTPKKKRRRKPTSVKQHDQMDCGAACLATVVRYYDKAISLATIRSIVHVTRDGASLLSIKQGADYLGFESIGVMCSIEYLSQLRTPFIALMQYHFVVVFEINDTHLIVGDPGRGIVEWPVDKFKEEYSRNALLLRPTDALYAQPNSAPAAQKYFQLLHGSRKELGHIVVLSLLIFAFGLVTPVITQVATDAVLVDGKVDQALVIVLVMLSLNIINTAANWVRGYLMTNFTSVVDAKFSCLFLRQIYALPLSYFAVRRVGDFTSRMGELSKLRMFFSTKPVGVLLNIISIFLYATVVGLYSPLLLGITAVMVPVMLGLIVFMTPKLTSLTADMYKIGSQANSLMYEHFRSLETLRALRGFIAARWRWESVILKGSRVAMRYQRMNAIFGGASALLQNIFNSVLFMTSVYLFMEHELTLGQVMAVTALASQVLGPATTLLTEWHNFNEFRMSLGRVDDVITAAREPEPIAGPLPPKIVGNIAFENVEFRYGSELSPLILRDVNLTISPGETIAIVGRSGSGKTTLGYMINMLYAPTSGNVTIDGLPIRSFPLPVLRRQVAMIMQENAMFSGSILDNITLGDAAPEFNVAVNAAKAADAHGFISKLKHGYATVLGEGGGGLSGGQRQRLNIARALYLDPTILVMDEATSALDSVSERAIVANIKARQGKRTTIIIAHRLNTVMHADRILVMDRGTVVESGPHRELLAKQGIYYDLFRKQISH